MANNRMYLCAVNEDNKIVAEIQIGKHTAGSWYLMDYLYDDPQEFLDKINRFFQDAFINACGIALKDEYMDIPLPALWHYNDYCERNGHWEFIEDKEDC